MIGVIWPRNIPLQKVRRWVRRSRIAVSPSRQIEPPLPRTTDRTAPPRDGVAPITLHFGHRFSLVFFRVRKAFECLSMTRIRGLWHTRAECHHFKRGCSYEGSRGVSPLGRHEDRSIPNRDRSPPKWRLREPRRLQFSLGDAPLGRIKSRRRAATAKARRSLCCQIWGFLRGISVLRSHPETGPFTGLSRTPRKPISAPAVPATVGRWLELCVLPVNGRLPILRERLPFIPDPFGIILPGGSRNMPGSFPF